MAQFSTLNLVNNQVLVAGVDTTGAEGKEVIDGTQWAELTAHTEHLAAHDDFDEAVEEFFAPLTAAVQKLEATAVISEDPISFIDFGEDIAATEAESSTRVHLTRDSIILRLIENNESDRLIWVGDRLEILAAPTDLFGEDPGDVAGFEEDEEDTEG